MSEPIISNILELSTSPLRKAGMEILEAGYEAILTPKIISENVRRDGNILYIKNEAIDLSQFENIYFLAIGKCAVSAGLEIEPLIVDKLTAGITLDVVAGQFQKIRSLIGTHPFPSEANYKATDEIVSLVSNLSEKDLVITVISGGGSALLASTTGLNLDQVNELTKLAFEKGVTIEDLNIVRKHLSKVKGGGLAKIMYPARVVSIIFSDVPGNNLETIASGPTVMDKSTLADAQSVIAKYGVFDILSLPGFSLVETPKEDLYFAKVSNILILSNETGLNAMKEKAESLGYASFIEDEALQGEAKEIGQMLGQTKLPNKSCFIYGGEATVTFNKGAGLGGRAQEMCVAALKYLTDDRLVIAAATDGWDNSEAGGALADLDLKAKITGGENEIDEVLENHSSFDFLKKIGGQIVTGCTGANVSDFYLVIKN